MDLRAEVKLVQRTAICFSCDKDSKSVSVAAKARVCGKKKARGGAGKGQFGDVNTL